MHTTYQYGDAAKFAYGKRQRLREHGLWLADPDSYYTQGKFIMVSDMGSSYPREEFPQNKASFTWKGILNGIDDLMKVVLNCRTEESPTICICERTS